MKTLQLGEFEEVVLLTVGILQDDAYGVTIRNDIENRLESFANYAPQIRKKGLRHLQSWRKQSKTWW
jgi:hypothetical protein